MYRILYFMLILGTLICSGCSQKSEQEKKLETELRMFKEKAITFPDNMSAKVCDGQLPPDTTLLNRPSKMVVYVGKEGCTNCKLKSLLPIYMFILENRHRKNFGVVIILHTANRENTEKLLTEMRFRQTVFYDLDGSFERLNPHLPSEEDLHTFLLNKENKVVLIGNPTHNEKLNKLYMTKINKLRDEIFH